MKDQPEHFDDLPRRAVAKPTFSTRSAESTCRFTLQSSGSGTTIARTRTSSRKQFWVVRSAMNKVSRNERSGIAIGFSLGFVLCLIGIGFWPAGPEEKHEYGANYGTEGHSTYYEISKTWGEWRAAMLERTSEDPVALYTLVLGISTVALVGYLRHRPRRE
jgi:hypothetical protein